MVPNPKHFTMAIHSANPTHLYTAVGVNSKKKRKKKRFDSLKSWFLKGSLYSFTVAATSLDHVRGNGVIRGTWKQERATFWRNFSVKRSSSTSERVNEQEMSGRTSLEPM